MKNMHKLHTFFPWNTPIFLSILFKDCESSLSSDKYSSFLTRCVLLETKHKNTRHVPNGTFQVRFLMHILIRKIYFYAPKYVSKMLWESSLTLGPNQLNADSNCSQYCASKGILQISSICCRHFLQGNELVLQIYKSTAY